MSVLASQLQLNLQSSSSSQGLLSTPIGDQGSVSQLGGSTSTTLSRGFDLVKLPNSDACASLLILARRANDLGDEREAISLLKEAYRLYPQPTSQSQWIRSARQILQECALRRGEVDAAEMQCIQLSALSPLNLDLQHHIDALYRLSLVLMERGHGTKSRVLLQSLIETCDGCGLSILCAGFRLTLAELLVRAGSPLNAIGPLLQALSLAQSFGLDTIRATAIVQLAHIHLLMATEADGNLHGGAGSGKKKTGKRHAIIASSMLDGIMPHVLQHGSALLQAQARLESVKAIILTSATLDATGHSNAKDLKSSNSSENHAIWSSALEEVEDIVEIATKLNCKRLLVELFYFKARLEHAIGLHVQRNLTAKLFRALSLASSSSTTLDQILSSEGARTYLAEPHYTSTWNQYYLDASRPLL
jgi:tetratricopeptide (TPR) repeat protein